VLLAPLRPVRYERQRTDKLCHGEDTRGEVLEELDGNTGQRWYRWVRQSASVGY
jgi:hypothetical protein